MTKRFVSAFQLAGLLLCSGSHFGCGTEEGSSGLVGGAAVSINELMPKNDTVLADEAGGYNDWLELYNSENAEVSLEGYYLSDDADDVFLQRLPAEAVVPPKGFLVLWVDGDLEQGPLHMRFKLGSDGDKVIFSDPDGVELDRVEFGAATVDQSYARFPDGTGEFLWCATATPGKPNGDSCPK
jgi:hypothetical protein